MLCNYRYEMYMDNFKAGMETLKNLRHGENVIELHDNQVRSKSDVGYVSVQLDNNDKKNIFVFMQHSDEIVETIFKSELIDVDESGYMFFRSELEIDPLNNCMVPKHRMATDDEIDKLLGRNIPLDKLPILRMSDPIRRWHNFPKGSIVAIERHQEDVYFRRVT